MYTRRNEMSRIFEQNHNKQGAGPGATLFEAGTEF